ncbi:MAG: alpha-L-arabinofuranosidase [Ardenticatenaceae bacterium]|nr:alpha-L-arabinofuranosidase [Ardenticatenaceae bacterium]
MSLVGKRPFFLVLCLVALAACQNAAGESTGGQAVPTASSLFADAKATAVPVPDDGGTAVAPPSTTAANLIVIDTTAQPVPINRLVLGTNLPAWIGREKTEDETFIARTIASGVTHIRIPGGSWSNGYNWLACETGADISGDTEACWSWPWGLRPTDFINFIKATGTEAMYTVNQNGTAQEAAALVAFFNGAVDDDRGIGIDVRGRDWGRVSDWAQLRSDNGNPDPLSVRYWEIGNETYGGNSESGTDCVSWGWEEVWTCDGREYVNGIGQGSERHEGFLEFRAAMQAVDSTIQVGAVGVTPQADWSEWGLEVIEEAGAALDFYIIHQYAYFDPPQTYAEILAQPQKVWPEIVADANAAFDSVGNGRTVPIALTEYNLFAVQDQDNRRMMKQAGNMLFMADTIGQMMQQGVALANQWNLVNGEADNGTDYGLLNADTFARSPQYYVFPLWARFGSAMLPVTTTIPVDSVLSVYAGRMDEQTFSLLAINKTGTAVSSEIQLDGLSAFTVSADVVQALSLDSETVIFNGIEEPADDLTGATAVSLGQYSRSVTFEFAPYSLTLLTLAANPD